MTMHIVHEIQGLSLSIASLTTLNNEILKQTTASKCVIDLSEWK